MALCARKTALLKVLTPVLRGRLNSLPFSSSGSGNSDDNDSKKSQNKLNNLHSYETVDDTDSLVKTTIIKRNSILQQPKTPEEILEEAAQTIANRAPEEETKDNSDWTRYSDTHNNECLTDHKRNVYWGHDGKKSIVGYDILQELEERLEEILSNDKDAPKSAEQDKKSEKEENDMKNLGKMSATLEGLNRLLSFYLFRSSLFHKHW
ncbi:uncharacterized protein LOC131676003 [Topomyia yanbarensis]|uniref:uncharacterized protein LOC131676003 n=1 Tax=Topomyia yanbarensis TaxID=2498891 RepID=UPI00273A9464|nr:uncharacterized protein LOC131676003 [Topomyia yanbarensis]